MTIYTTAYFISRANPTHNNKFDYSKTLYVNTNTKVIIICYQHGEFLQSPKKHLKGQGCPKCAGLYRSMADFIVEANISHLNKYNYLLINKSEPYSAKLKFPIICQLHGTFYQRAGNHLDGKGCPKCATALTSSVLKSNTTSFIDKAKIAHGTDFDYSKVDYILSSVKICITCNKCKSDFFQTPSNHLFGAGCPHCNRSRGEKTISKILSSLGIRFDIQVRIPGCKSKKLLPFDFGVYLDTKIIGLIEFQGIQHYKPVCVWGGDDGLKITQNRDKIKKEYCNKHNIPLLIIPYWNKTILATIQTFLLSI
jgi:protein-arginine kinase activator protein McsA